MSPDLAAGIRRVKGAKKFGVRIGNWLTAAQSKALLKVFDRGNARGKRDYAIGCRHAGCGLRRAELAAVDVQHLQKRKDHWVFADMIGKGGRVRTVPIPAWFGDDALQSWIAEASITSGPIFRAINKAGRIAGGGFSLKVIGGVVRKACGQCGLINVAPHDLRRTCRAT